jgi:pimeloyl-ACP methyl ester carboxylesterase
MTIMLVHGVPETTAVWDLLVDELVALGRDEPLRLSPPGFGAPVPDGWAATLDDYTAWLVGELETSVIRSVSSATILAVVMP